MSDFGFGKIIFLGILFYVGRKIYKSTQGRTFSPVAVNPATPLPVTVNPELYERYKTEALSMWDKGEKWEAASKLEKALQADPNDANMWYKLGYFYDSLSSGTYGGSERTVEMKEKAVASLQKAIKLKPDLAEAHYLLGNVVWDKDFRLSLKSFEEAAKYDSQYESAVRRTKSLIAECTYTLSGLQAEQLNSCKESPLPHMYNYEFYCEDPPIESAIIYSCVSGTKQQWANCWLFANKNPDLFANEPIAELVLSSTGDINISHGTPSNYHMLLTRLKKEDLL